MGLYTSRVKAAAMHGGFDTDTSASRCWMTLRAVHWSRDLSMCSEVELDDF